MNRYFSFILSASLLSAFAFGVIPWLEGHIAVEYFQDIQANGIDPSGVFYTETRETGEAYNYFRNIGR